VQQAVDEAVWGDPARKEELYAEALRLGAISSKIGEDGATAAARGVAPVQGQGLGRMPPPRVPASDAR